MASSTQSNTNTSWEHIRAVNNIHFKMHLLQISPSESCAIDRTENRGLKKSQTRLRVGFLQQCSFDLSISSREFDKDLPENRLESIQSEPTDKQRGRILYRVFRETRVKYVVF